jgi:hypothetical protein
VDERELVGLHDVRVRGQLRRKVTIHRMTRPEQRDDQLHAPDQPDALVDQQLARQLMVAIDVDLLDRDRHAQRLIDLRTLD